MELNFFGKMINTFSQPLSSTIASDFKVDKKKLLQETNNTIFHTDCKYTKKKVCYCKHIEPSNTKVNNF